MQKNIVLFLIMVFLSSFSTNVFGYSYEGQLESKPSTQVTAYDYQSIIQEFHTFLGSLEGLTSTILADDETLEKAKEQRDRFQALLDQINNGEIPKEKVCEIAKKIVPFKENLEKLIADPKIGEELKKILQETLDIVNKIIEAGKDCPDSYPTPDHTSTIFRAPVPEKPTIHEHIEEDLRMPMNY